jgi:tetratricopeptide (TPR) repeat protein
VDEVVSVLTNPSLGSDGATLSLKEQLQLAAEEYDKRAAEAFGRALVDSLCEDPGDARRLEALLILGLAHPSILAKYHVSLAAEGRRLCVLLENLGDVDRARGLLELLTTRLPDERELQQDLASMMRRHGDTDQLVDRCLERADKAVQSGKPMDAIPWLQEVLLHDQTRRDVARMIRDLRYQEMETLARQRRRNRLVLILVVISTALSAVFVREQHIGADYGALPSFTATDSAAISARIVGLDTLIADNSFWFGMFNVVGERSRLQEMHDRLGAKQAKVKREKIARDLERQSHAETKRLAAIDAAMAAKYDEAKELFQGALALGDQDWDRRERIEANIAAIDDLLQKQD